MDSVKQTRREFLGRGLAMGATTLAAASAMPVVAKEATTKFDPVVEDIVVGSGIEGLAAA